MRRSGLLVLAAFAVVALVGAGAETGFLGRLLWGAPSPAAEPAGKVAAPPAQPAKPVLAGPEVAKPAPSGAEFRNVDRDLDLHGTVVAEDDKPVAGALLTAVVFPWEPAWTPNDVDRYAEVERGRTRSAADGTFAIRLSRGESVVLRAAPAGFASSERDGCQAGQRVRVVLSRPVRLSVTVQDDAKKPVAGLRVNVQRADHAGGLASERWGTTDAAGVHVFEDLPSGAWVSISTARDAIGTDAEVALVLPISGEAKRVVVVPTGRTIKGRVTDADTGAPIAGATVGPQATVDRRVNTGADGAYAFPNFSGKPTVEFGAAAAGYVIAFAEVGENRNVDFHMKRGIAAKGRVTGGGKPVPGAYVMAVAWDYSAGTRAMSMGYATTDAAGLFSIGGLDRSAGHTWIVRADGLGRTLLDVAAPPAGQAAIDLGDVPLPPPRAIEGRALDDGGKAIPSIYVFLTGANADRGRLWNVREHPNAYFGETQERTTDDLGRFRFRDLAAGTYSLTLRSPGRPELKRDVVLAADADTTALDISYTALHPMTILAVDVAGNPVPDALVAVEDGAGGVSARTGPTGRVTLLSEKAPISARVVWFGPRPGPYLAPPPTPIAEGQTEVRIAGEPAGHVSGVVLDDEALPLAYATIDVVRNGHTLLRATSVRDGRFESDVPAEGTVSLVLADRPPWKFGDPAPLVAALDWIPAGRTNIRLQASRLLLDRSLTVSALAPDGSPAEGALAWVGPVVIDGEFRTDAKGLVRFDELPGVALEVRAWAGDTAGPGRSWLAPPPVSVVPAGQTIVMRFRGGVRLDGTVVGPTGEAVRWATIDLKNAKGRTWAARSDAHGKFAVLFEPEEDSVLSLSIRGKDDGGLLHGSKEGVRPIDGTVAVRLERGP